jgi:hypothetical protein
MAEENGKMSDEKMKHLEFIQNVITRMNTNSFHIKGWSVTIVSALLAIYASIKDVDIILAAIFPTLALWFLDTYYLLQERKFRGVYNDVAGLAKEPKEVKPFAMPVNEYKGGEYSYFNVFWSKTIFTLYFSIILF